MAKVDPKRDSTSFVLFMYANSSLKKYGPVWAGMSLKLPGQKWVPLRPWRKLRDE